MCQRSLYSRSPKNQGDWGAAHAGHACLVSREIDIDAGWEGLVATLATSLRRGLSPCRFESIVQLVSGWCPCSEWSTCPENIQLNVANSTPTSSCSDSQCHRQQFASRLPHDQASPNQEVTFYPSDLAQCKHIQIASFPTDANVLPSESRETTKVWFEKSPGVCVLKFRTDIHRRIACNASSQRNGTV